MRVSHDAYEMKVAGSETTELTVLYMYLIRDFSRQKSRFG